ncbi:protein unc-13 homolog A isoform X1 [Lates japonicus]|uniref:Protein unc-13 homolog A isoform X1 n=1 Tax=Lates japonicus TaxID=270547 RepID=A0AAD3R851_LATJO|nr:protein unc-13 homolog A isoform X1 [Lates japonicus]
MQQAKAEKENGNVVVTVDVVAQETGWSAQTIFECVERLQMRLTVTETSAHVVVQLSVEASDFLEELQNKLQQRDGLTSALVFAVRWACLFDYCLGERRCSQLLQLVLFMFAVSAQIEDNVEADGDILTQVKGSDRASQWQRGSGEADSVLQPIMDFLDSKSVRGAVSWAGAEGAVETGYEHNGKTIVLQHLQTRRPWRKGISTASEHAARRKRRVNRVQ